MKTRRNVDKRTRTRTNGKSKTIMPGLSSFLFGRFRVVKVKLLTATKWLHIVGINDNAVFRAGRWKPPKVAGSAGGEEWPDARRTVSCEAVFASRASGCSYLGDLMVGPGPFA